MSVRNELPVRIKDRNFVLDLSRMQTRETESFRTGLDSGAVAGEQSLSAEDQWIRGQWNWEMGANQKWFDRRDSDRRRFHNSLGVDPFTQDEELILPGGANNRSEANIVKMVTANGYLYALQQGGTHAVRRASSAGGAFASVTGLGSTILDITTDGETVWTCDGTDIYSFTAAGAATVFSTFNAFRVGFAQGRLLASDNGSIDALYEIDSAGTATLVWQNTLMPTFAWDFFAPSPVGIYAFGNAGDRSYGYLIQVADATGELVPPYQVLELPAGETLYDAQHYGGLFILGTSRGLRLATIQGNGGFLTFGPVIEIPGGVRTITTRGEDIYFGWGGHSFTPPGVSAINAAGLGRARLKEFTETLVPPYSSHCMVRTGGTFVYSSAYFDGALFFDVNGNLYNDQANPDVGYVDSGYVEFGSVTQNKRLTGASVRHDALPSGCSVALTAEDEDAAATTLVTSSTVGATGQREPVALDPGERWRVVLTMTPSGANSPVVKRWAIEAVPKAYHSEDLMLPVMLYDVVEADVADVNIGFDIWEEYQWLRGLAETREVVDIEIGSRVLKGYVKNVAIGPGDVEDWNGGDSHLEYLTGTYMVIIRTVEP